jgi:hypothetical protein
MELSVLDRLLILNLDTLPNQGNILTMKVKQQLISDVGFSEQEFKDFNLKNEGGEVTWNPDAPSVDITIGEQAKKILVNALDKSESLTVNHISLYDRLKE